MTVAELASRILLHPGLLQLKTRRIQKDCQERFGVGRDTALGAIALARETAGGIRNELRNRIFIRRSRPPEPRVV